MTGELFVDVSDGLACGQTQTEKVACILQAKVLIHQAPYHSCNTDMRMFVGHDKNKASASQVQVCPV